MTHQAHALSHETAVEDLLVVDDDQEVREAICDVLADEGYSVGQARHGLEALARLARGPLPALIVLDLTMPVMDGYEFLERRDRDPVLATIPVVVVSATIDVRVDRFDVTFLRKPIELDALLEVIRAGIERPARLLRVAGG